MKGYVKYIVGFYISVLLPTYANGGIFEDWYENTLPRYQMQITDIIEFYGDTAVLLDALSDDSGIRIKINTLRSDMTENYVVCFYGCHDKNMYEAKSNTNSVICWDCKYQDCEMWPFLGYCKTCPSSEVSGINAVLSDNPTSYDIRDCVIPKNTVIKDESGTFIFTDDCHYSE